MEFDCVDLREKGVSVGNVYPCDSSCNSSFIVHAISFFSSFILPPSGIESLEFEHWHDSRSSRDSEATIILRSRNVKIRRGKHAL